MTSVTEPTSSTTTTTNETGSPSLINFKRQPPLLPPVLAAPPPPPTVMSSTEAATPTTTEPSRRPVRLPQKVITDTTGPWTSDQTSTSHGTASTTTAVKGALRRSASTRAPPPPPPPPHAAGWSTSSSRDGSVSDGDPPMLSKPKAKVYTGLKDPQTLLKSTLPPAPESAAKRGYDELEEITFQNPASFKAMVFAIAATRGQHLRVSDDRTHKVTSAYMHITCDYKGSGCPFILKLTKAKEGGWVLKSAKATDVDPKQRSNYRCRHPAGSKPDPPAGPGSSLSSTTSHPGPSGSKPKAAKPRPSLPTKPASTGVVASASTPSTVARRGEPHSDPVTRERSLAPPFARSVSMQITPAIASSAGPHRNHGPTASGSKSRSSASASPAPLATKGSAQASGPVISPPPLSPSVSNIAPAYHAPSRPDSLAKWRDVLARLDAELLPLADILASPQVDAHPASFFRESESLQQLLLDSLDLPAWLKVKLKVKISEQGRSVWADIEAGRRTSLLRFPVSSEPSTALDADGDIDAEGSNDEQDVSMNGHDADDVVSRQMSGSNGSPPVAGSNTIASPDKEMTVLEDDKGKGRQASPPLPTTPSGFAAPPPPRPPQTNGTSVTAQAPAPFITSSMNDP